jgi:uncharacterized surface protein with fasciclin (FAS1) repeats
MQLMLIIFNLNYHRFKNKQMKTNFKKVVKLMGAALLATTFFLTSCNKGFEDVPGANTTNVSTQNLAEKLNADANYSIFRSALIKYGLFNRLANQGNYTLLAMDNPTLTFVLSTFGLTPAQFDALPPAAAPSVFASLAGLFTYHVIPQNMPAANLPNSFSAATTLYPAQVPNAQVPSSLNIGTFSGAPVMMSAFLAKNGGNAFANTTPIVQPDAIVASNGVLHKVAAPVIPPSQTLGQMIAADPNLTYLAAAVARADSGQVVGTTAQLGYVLNLAVANVTVFAPTDVAFKTLLTGAIAQALIAQGMAPATALATATALAATPAVFTNPALATVLTPTMIRGIVVYHLLGSRAYSVNLPLATQNLKTLLNGGIPAHPGVLVDRSTATPRLLGLANGAGNFSNFATTDRNCVNGVIHVIDRVLLPQ